MLRTCHLTFWFRASDPSSNFTTNQHKHCFSCSKVATSEHVLKLLVPLSVKQLLVQRSYSHTREH